MPATFPRYAAIDLGTNTFQCIIVEPYGSTFRALHKETLVMKIGQGGISQGVITEDAYVRTLQALVYLRSQLDHYHVEPEHVFATATSAIRSAGNGLQLVQDIYTQTGIRVEVINGLQEAQYIYQGVKAALALGEAPALIMDIGGGSVEFIIGDESQLYWKQSFEIGAQRLLDRFMTADPIPADAVAALDSYLLVQLAPLANAVKQYQPHTLVGSAGAFETLAEIYYQQIQQPYDVDKSSEFTLPLEGFFSILPRILTQNREQRLQIPGMLAMRVDMIVMACCLINFILQHYPMPQPIRVSTYSLKEGVIQAIIEQNKKSGYTTTSD